MFGWAFNLIIFYEYIKKYPYKFGKAKNYFIKILKKL